MTESITRLGERGQSIWLDFIRRAFIDSGDLQRLIDEHWITGLTSNPTIFAKAISGSADYDDELREIAATGEHDPYAAFVRLASADIRRAADAFRSVYDSTAGADGFVSLETPPGIEHDSDATIAEAKRLFALVDRPNLLIKVPGTAAGIRALEQLIADGVNVNVTLLFDTGVYEQVAEAYIAGLERRLDVGGDISRVASVASFFVSRVDTAVERVLPEDSPLRGTAAVANARHAYHRSRAIFDGARWQRLAEAGARVQRPLWASTSTKNPAYRDVMYVEDLIAPDTVNTMPEATLRAFADHGQTLPAPWIDEPAETERALRQLREAGVDMAALTERLLEEGLASFAADFDGLLECIREALEVIPSGRVKVTASLGGLAATVDERIAELARSDATHRIWSGDHTLWAKEPVEIADRLGWLTVIEAMAEQADDLTAFADGVRTDGIEHVALLGMGGSSLAPEVLYETFGREGDGLRLTVLDTTDPASIRALEAASPPERTLFVVASKSGTTLETLSQLAYFWDRVPDGRHFIAITDPGTPLEATARERGFRRVFVSPPDIGGRYSALSHFGLVPAALAGVDLHRLLDEAAEMQQACHSCVPTVSNPGAWLGALLGEAAKAGRDKLTLVLPEAIASFGTWVEQLIAESTGKEGRGILPVEGEPLGPPEVYGEDRLFVAIGDHAGLDALEAAGHPVVRLPYREPYQLGAEFFRWEFATAVAGHVLGIHPFDQPNVQQAKDATARILGGETVDEATPPLRELLASVQPGDYIAILAYLPRTAAHTAALQAVRMWLRDRYRVATTVGFGPRFLHSTGQLHKGGPPTGVFIQIVGDDPEDLAIPGQPYTFGQFKHAQALGDLASLRGQGRRVARVTLEEIEELVK